MIRPAKLGIPKEHTPLTDGGIVLGVKNAIMKAGEKGPAITGIYSIPTKPEWWEGDEAFTAHHQIAFTFIDCEAWIPSVYNIVPAPVKQAAAGERIVGSCRVGGFEIEIPMFAKVLPKRSYHLVASLGPYVSKVLVLRSN